MSSLNEDQKRAAAHSRGHAVVLAGPGTGKTSTLIARHAVLISRDISPQNVFVVTFTQKAAEEIRNRLGERAGARPWIGTFHSHCLRLLKRFHEVAGLPKNFRVLDPGGQQRALREMGVDWNQDDGDLLAMFSMWKDALVSPDEAAAEAARKSNPTERRAAEHYADYQRHLEQNGNLDFSDLVIKGLSILRNSPEVRKYVSDNLPYALVDEFQDVNRVQVELLQAMASAGTNIWAVGDDDQALYGWRGSNVFYTVQFENYFSPAAKYTLKTNYRCDPAILRVATALIANNRHRVKKQLNASRAHGKNNVVRVSAFRDDREEAAWIASSIEGYLGRGARPRDIGILVRTSSLTAHIQQALELKKISMSLTGALNFWDTPEVKAVCDLLEAIETGDEKVGYRYRGGADLITTLEGLSPERTSVPVAQFLAAQPPANSNSERVATWADAVEAIASMAAVFPTATAFKTHVTNMSAMVSTQSSDGVNLTTIHSSKGLEYRHVFIPGCEASIMPHRKSTDVEEERRLFYVAITRSKGAVDASFSRFRMGKKQQPSPFLAEINAANSDGNACVVWAKSAEPDTAQEQAAAVEPAKKASQARVAERPKGLPTVYYRKDGSRTLVPPEE
jgi:DNA helicase-2/ATP-dependent DNA helicase PcrA|nr:ATP-dependent helicase [Neorhizobium tomejilense]